MAISKATLGMSKKTFKAGSREFGAGVSKLYKAGDEIKAGKAPMFKDDVKGAARFYPKKDVAAVRAEVTRPKRIPSVQETGRIKHPQNAWRQPQLSPDYMKGRLPHQTSSWTAKKKGY